MSDWGNRNVNKVVRKLLDSYAAKGVYFDIKKKVVTLPNNRLCLNVKVLPETRVKDIKLHANDVRLSLKLPVLDVVEGQAHISIIISSKLSVGEHYMWNISNTPEFAEAKKTMGIALSLGIDELGNPVIVDLMAPRCPHIIVSGTTGSGKSAALRSMLTMMALMYPPRKVNLLIGDQADELSQFACLPHLSYPNIEDFDTLLQVMLVVKGEMDRRIKIKHTEEFTHLPAIVCVIDEFISFMDKAPNKRESDLAIAVITQILRRGRHARIHLILAAHDPTSKNMRIKTSDLPVKMAFQVSNVHNSVTVLGQKGAENLRGKGDMLFKMNGEIRHLQGAFIPEDEIASIVKHVCQKHGIFDPFHMDCIDNRFLISNEDLQRNATEIQKDELSLLPITSSRRSAENNDDRIFAKVAEWTLSQDEISCNQIAEGFRVGWRRANSFILRLHDLGIVGDLDAKLPRKVLLHSVEELPKDVAELLQVT